MMSKHFVRILSRVNTSYRLPSDCYPRFLTSSSSTSILPSEENITKDPLFKSVKVEVKGHEEAVLRAYKKFVLHAANLLGVAIIRVDTPPRIFERRTVLKSAFGHKKHRVQYETRNFFNVFVIKHITGSTADTFLEYIQRNLPEGVAMAVTKEELRVLPDYISHDSADLEQARERLSHALSYDSLVQPPAAAAATTDQVDSADVVGRVEECDRPSIEGDSVLTDSSAERTPAGDGGGRVS